MVIILLGVLIQFVPVDRSNPPVSKSVNFVDLQKTPKKIQIILKTACYDCHSYETVYPDYAYVAPVSWSVKHHVNEGREHLNFSEWGHLNRDLRKNMLENAIADIEQNRMPIAGYMVYHPDARLSLGEKKILVDYLTAVLKSEKY